MSQLTLANMIGCERSLISKIELGKRTISNEYLIELSKALNFDFVTLNKNLKKYNNVSHYTLTYKLIDCVKNNDFTQMEKLLHDPMVINKFNYDKPLIIKLYCTALVEHHVHKNYKKSIDICFRSLDTNYKNINSFYPRQYQTHRYYSIILILGANFCMLKEYTLSKTLLESTINFLENNFFNETLPFSSIEYFYKKFYINILNNYADTLFILKDYENAFSYCEKAIIFANENDISFLIGLLLKLKFEILYNLNMIEKAKKTYFHFMATCELKGNIEYLEKTKKLIEEKYPLILQ